MRMKVAAEGGHKNIVDFMIEKGATGIKLKHWDNMYHQKVVI